MKSIRLTVFLFFFIFYLPAFSADYLLFNKAAQLTDRSIPIENYNKLVQHNKILPGDTLRFSNGREILAGSILGHGHNTLVLRIKNSPNQALRIPYSVDSVPFDYRKYFNRYANGSEILTRLGVPVVQVQEQLPFEYQIVELIDPHDSMNFFDFIKRYERFSDEQRAPIISALLSFARQSAELSKIGDFTPAHLVYQFSQKRWLIMDLDDEIFKTEIKNLKSIASLDSLFTFPVHSGWYYSDIGYFWIAWISINRQKGMPFDFVSQEGVPPYVEMIAREVQNEVINERTRLLNLKQSQKPHLFSKLKNLCSLLLKE